MNKIIFFGTEDFSATTLSTLLNDGYNIEAVVTKPDFKRGRGKKLSQPVVKQIALQHNIPVLQPDKISHLPSMLKNMNKNIGVLVSYGKIIPQSIIDLFELGIINLHPSLLPKYRGATPIESAILNGDKETGVSIMLLDAKMDAGPVYAQKRIKLNQSETAPELYNHLGTLGAKLISNTLPDILDGSLKPTPQKHSLATFTKLLRKEDGVLNVASKSSHELVNQVRAYCIYPKSFIQLDNERLIITKAHSSVTRTHKLSILTKDDTYFVIDNLINRNGKHITALDYINHLQNN